MLLESLPLIQKLRLESKSSLIDLKREEYEAHYEKDFKKRHSNLVTGTFSIGTGFGILSMSVCLEKSEGRSCETPQDDLEFEGGIAKESF